jgi:HSP20 family protein
MSTELKEKEKQEVTTTSAEQLVDSKNSYKPDVDIYNSEDNLILVADLPGIKKGDVSIDVDENNVLTLKAKSNVENTSGAIYRQFNTGNYFRAFTLSNEFNKDKISARLENGVLEITIPRREEVKPKRIQINV